MNTMFARLRSAAEKRARYNRTVFEIEHMPRNVALDLGIYPEDAHSIAQNTVYGV